MLWAGYLIVVWAIVVRDLVVAGLEIHPWVIGDWLIDYSAGFVRRGLPGELLATVARLTGASRQNVVVATLGALYAALFLLVHRLGRPLLGHWSGWAVLLSPATFAFWALDRHGSGRKEILFLVSLAAFAVALRNGRGAGGGERATAWALAFLGVVLTLSHEMLFLYTPFFLLLLVRERGFERRIPVRYLLCWLPAGLAFLASVLGRGDATIVAEICGSLGASAPADCQGFSSIGYLAHDLRSAVDDVRATAWLPQWVAVYVISLALGGVPLWIAWRRAFGGKAEVCEIGTPALRACVGLCVAVPLPLFAAGYDWGRFLNLYFVGFAVVLAAADRRESRLVGPRRASRSDTLNRAAIAAAIVAYATTWGMPHTPGPLRTGWAGEAFGVSAPYRAVHWLRRLAD